MSNVVNRETETTDDLVAFHKFIGELLANGSHGMAPEEALDHWRAEHPLPEDFEETVESLHEAFEELDAGVPGIPAEQFFREFREHHNLPPRP